LGNIIPKMILYQMAVLSAFVLDVWLLGEFIKFILSIDLLFTKLVSMTLIFIEILSINENFTFITGKNLFKSFKLMITRASSIKEDIKKLNE